MLLRCLDVNRFGLADGVEGNAVDIAAWLAAHGRKEPVLDLLLPAAHCLLATVPVTAHEAKLLPRTLPWMLEERLLEPAEQMHVTGAQVEAGQARASAIQRAWLAQVLGNLAAAGLHPRSADSELLVLPWRQGCWTVFVAAEAPVLVRHGEHAGFACSPLNLPLALQLLLNESDGPPARVDVHLEPGGHFETTQLPALLQSRAQLAQNSWWQLARTVPARPVNLLQGSFAPPLPWARWWRQWRLAACLLLGLGLGDLALTGLDSARLTRQAEANEAELVALYRSVQPEGVVVDPRLQLEEAIAALGGGHPGFLALMSRMAPALQAVPAARVQNLEYDGATGAVQMLVETDGFATAEKLRATLQDLGLQAELLGSSSDGSGNRTRLRVGA